MDFKIKDKALAIELEDIDIRREFVRVFSKLTIQHEIKEAFDDFIVITACTISNMVDKDHFEEREKKYSEIINKYTRAERQVFPELFSLTIVAMEKNSDQNFISDIYKEVVGFCGEKPISDYQVAKFLAYLMVDNIDKAVKENGFNKIHDKECLHGSMLIAAFNITNEMLSKENLKAENYIFVIGEDDALISVLISYIQLSIIGAVGYFKVCNQDDCWYTPEYFNPVWVERRKK